WDTRARLSGRAAGLSPASAPASRAGSTARPHWFACCSSPRAYCPVPRCCCTWRCGSSCRLS
ncbi:MAG: hypothetical protein AVDCRST_MAG67-2810, partial [uncultured Solirubrobacteraceae bacterium]